MKNLKGIGASITIFLTLLSLHMENREDHSWRVVSLNKYDGVEKFKRHLPKRFHREFNSLSSHLHVFSQKYQVPPHLILAVIWTESSFRPLASSGVAHGLMQLKVSTAKEICERQFQRRDCSRETITSNKFLNLELGVIYLKFLLDDFKKIDLPRYTYYDLAVLSYNEGLNRVKRRARSGQMWKEHSYLNKVKSRASLLALKSSQFSELRTLREQRSSLSHSKIIENSLSFKLLKASGGTSR